MSHDNPDAPKTLPCIKCQAPAHMIREGLETDFYKCSKCGAEFGVSPEY